MKPSTPMILARAMADAKSGTMCDHHLDAKLTDAQAGAALRLWRTGAIELAGSSAAAVHNVESELGSLFYGGRAATTIGRDDAALSALENLIGPWFAEAPSRLETAAAGYWLADVYLNGVDPQQAAVLTRFLAGPMPLTMAGGRPTAVRRYPTGGISEKQALILPPILRVLASEMGWCSPFLVARRLAHTGGTADKLAILPGFSTVSADRLASWDGTTPPVVYFSAGPDLCPRDAIMYRMRGETGTVADLGLMAASIMSKQIASPADVVVLDVIYGRTAFLSDEESARAFGELCRSIGNDNSVIVDPAYRSAETMLGRTVGSSTEVLEAVAILRGDATYDTAIAEKETAVWFVERIAELSGRSPARARRLAESAISSGEAFEQLGPLWSDHGVDRSFLATLQADPRIALLGGLETAEIRAANAGRLQVDPVALADAVNELVNRLPDSPSGDTRRGGVEVLADEGAEIVKGETVAIIYGAGAASAAPLVASAVTSSHG